MRRAAALAAAMLLGAAVAGCAGTECSERTLSDGSICLVCESTGFDGEGGQRRSSSVDCSDRRAG